MLEGVISAISPVVDEGNGVVQARVALPNPDQKLKPGLFVDVYTTKQTALRAPKIPTAALVFDENKSYVVTYEGDCKVEAVQVHILAKEGDSVYVKGPLATGNKIIIKY